MLENNIAVNNVRLFNSDLNIYLILDKKNLSDYPTVKEIDYDVQKLLRHHSFYWYVCRTEKELTTDYYKKSIIYYNIFNGIKYNIFNN